MSITDRVVAHHREQLGIEQRFVLPPATVAVERGDDHRVRAVSGGHRSHSRPTRLRSLTPRRTASAGSLSILHRVDETRRRRLAVGPGR